MTTLVDWLEGVGTTSDGAGAHGLRLLDRRESASFRSWGQLVAEARRVAVGLRAEGVIAGDRVALIHPTGWEFLHAFFGCVLAGAVPTPLYPPVRLARLDEYSLRTAAMLEASGATLVVADPRVRRILGPALERARPRLGCRIASELEVEGSSTPFSAPDPEDLALVQFSSGTTVDPKPVALSHRAIVAQVETLSHAWPEDGTEHSGVAWLPLYHDMGLIGCLLSALQRGATLTLIPPEVFVAYPAIWLRAISRYRATISPAPNFAYALAAERVTDDQLEGVDLSCWRIALDGAESVAPDVLRAFCRRFAPFGFRPEALTPVYGLSEASLAVTFSPLSTPFRTERFARPELSEEGRAVVDPDGLEIVSVGSPLAGFSVEIRDELNLPVEPGTVGAVWVAGPSLMSEYLGRPEATRRALQGGWLDTGDAGFLHDDELFLTGRRKDLLILNGRNHPPEEVEQAVSALPGVRTGCVVARSELEEGASGEKLWLFVERARSSAKSLDRDTTLGTDDEALRQSCRQASLRAIGISPHAVELLAPGALPRTSSGKLRRAETWRRYRAGELSAPPSPGVVGLTRRIVASEWKRRRFERVRHRDRDDDA
ncbi:MAG: fatty acyl-AMP ligase [Thermoanaerobaculia bacterium]|nr:fatty acyl-AMP ligase [Thermoanaerobaculia bacterium]